MDNNLRQQAEELAGRPYRFRLQRDETTDGRPMFLAGVVEVTDCVGHGETERAAIDDARQALIDYIQSLLEDNMPVPVPHELLPVSKSRGSHVSPVSRVIRASWQPAEQETLRPNYVQAVPA